MDSQDSLTKTEQVVSALRASIMKGEIPAGGKLRSVRALASEFKVSQWIVSSALETLDSEGLVRREQGRGVFAEEAPKNGEIEVYMLLWGVKRDVNTYTRALTELANPNVMPEGFAFTTRTVFIKDKASLAQELSKIDRMRNVKCVVASMASLDERTASKFNSLHCPALFLGDSAFGKLEELKANRVILEPQGGAEAVALLASQGFKAVSLIVGSRSVYYYEKFASTVERACEKAGLALRLFELPASFLKKESEEIRLFYKNLLERESALFKSPLLLYGFEERTLVEELDASGLAPERLPAIFPQIHPAFLGGYYARIYSLIREIVAEPGKTFKVSHVAPVLLEDLRNGVSLVAENGAFRPFEEA